MAPSFTELVPLPVPEPSTWAMLLIGFAGLCFAFCRTRRAPSIVDCIPGFHSKSWLTLGGAKMSARIIKLCSAVLATFIMTAGAAPAGSIAISDNDPNGPCNRLCPTGVPTVEISGDLEFLLGSPKLSQGRASFDILPDGGPFLSTGNRAVFLTEVGGTISDFVTAFAFEPTTLGQVIRFLFESDNAPTFETDLDDLIDSLFFFHSVGFVVENGSAQDVSGSGLLDTAPAITVTIQSASPFSPRPAPEPATWAMMLLGFVGLAYAGWRRTRAGAPSISRGDGNFG
jgi:PEP-CTERM motif